MVENLSYASIVSLINENNLKNLYLFYGPETFLINDILQRFEKRILKPDLKSLNYIKLDGPSASYDSIINACETLPIMDEKKIVVIDDCNLLKNKKYSKDSAEDNSQTEDLCSYFSRIPDTAILILIAGSEIDKRKKIYNSIKKYGSIVEFIPFKNQELIKWLVKEFDRQNKTIGRIEVSYFADIVSGNLSDIANEVNKLCSYAGKSSTISKSDIDAVVTKSVEISIFKLIDSISAKKTGYALAILNELLLNSEPIPVILSMIVRQYRLLLNAKLLVKKGYANIEIAGKLGLKPYVLTNLLGLIDSYTELQIQEKLQKCLATDMAIKKGKMDQRIAIESLIVEFAR